MIYKYKKVIDEYTTYKLIEPDYELSENVDRITELCTINDETYINIPNSVVLPSQPEIITSTLIEVTLTDTLKNQISKKSMHIKLINQRVIERIRKLYSVNEEFKISRNKISLEPGADIPYEEFNAYVKNCVAWGKTEKAKIGL